MLTVCKSWQYGATQGWKCGRLYDTDVGLWPGSQTQTDRSPQAVHPSAELGVESALGAADGLILLAASGVARVLMDFDAAGVDES
jgi:hypothetical protein